MDPVIQVEGLSKRYRLGPRPAGTLRERISQAGRRLTRSLQPGQAGAPAETEFWALKDVAFEVGRGEVVGIIGRNGAGKSTLLKILSRITEPTKGRASIRGRVASLLEVGTGFHPELSGRDNIFLNGAILGLRRREILARFDEIVSFAEIERFIDTPVKHYSSGMYVRLAFAVAAHLEPEILIIDEVLAVGDTQFQKKCIGKIQSIARATERTVLFISHDMSAISSLTTRCLLLQEGALIQQGPTAQVVAAYQSMTGSRTEYVAPARKGRPQVTHIAVQCSEAPGVQAAGKPLQVRIALSHAEAIRGACVSFQIFNQNNQPATHAWVYAIDTPFATSPGESLLECTMPRLHLNVGEYHLRVYFSEPPGGAFFDDIDTVCPFRVIMLEPTQYWGWRPDACVYHEEATWKVTSPVVSRPASAP